MLDRLTQANHNQTAALERARSTPAENDPIAPPALPPTLASLSLLRTTPRPPPPASDIAQRSAMELLNDRAGEAMDLDPYDTLATLTEISPQYALGKLQGQHKHTGPLGCWFRKKNGVVQTEEYYKFNMRNSKFQGGDVGIQVYIHQLAIVASGNAGALRLCGQHQDFEASHLCGRRGCFNPDHLVVETKGLNKRRQLCQGKRILKVRGVTIHPCTHGQEENMRLCILGEEELRTDGTHFILQDGSDALCLETVSE